MGLWRMLLFGNACILAEGCWRWRDNTGQPATAGLSAIIARNDDNDDTDYVRDDDYNDDDGY